MVNYSSLKWKFVFWYFVQNNFYFVALCTFCKSRKLELAYKNDCVLKLDDNTDFQWYQVYNERLTISAHEFDVGKIKCRSRCIDFRLFTSCLGSASRCLAKDSICSVSCRVSMEITKPRAVEMSCNEQKPYSTKFWYFPSLNKTFSISQKKNKIMRGSAYAFLK